jgi:peptidoglycan/xylan/chitin deacetylase (PgdA/CDA1 family)
MTLVPIKTPLVVKKMFPNYIWNKATTEKVIYLTFDDGPTPEITNWTLQVLKEHNAKATFFCISNNVEKHPDIFNNILKDEHTIGNHTHNHLKGWAVKTNDYLKDIDTAQNVIENQILDSNIVNQKSKTNNLFRPPYGQIKPKQGKKLIALGYKIIMWDILSFDWDKNITKEQCLGNVLDHTVNGSIVVFHDSLKASKNMMYTLPKVLDYYNKLGYQFKALEV